MEIVRMWEARAFRSVAVAPRHHGEVANVPVVPHDRLPLGQVETL